MVIIVTGTIEPNSDMQMLAVRDTSVRLSQYIEALDRLIEAGTNSSIVFCDNSGYGIEAFESLTNKAHDKGISFEALSFKGNSDEVIRHGKGYGEGEILEYVLQNSSLVKNEDYMIKITGRLRVDNISGIVKRIKCNKIYFNIPDIHHRHIFDTRIYAMPISVFKQYFSDKYKTVDDNGGFFLEHAYTKSVRDNKLAVRNFPLYPRIVGVSGSGGFDYGYVEWKSRIRDLLSLFNLYGRV